MIRPQGHLGPIIKIDNLRPALPTLPDHPDAVKVATHPWSVLYDNDGRGSMSSS